jgi:hypothetical protein
LRIDILTRRRFGDFFSGDQGDGGEVLGPQTSDNIVVTFFGIEAVPQRVEQEGEVFCSKAFEECEFSNAVCIELERDAFVTRILLGSVHDFSIEVQLGALDKKRQFGIGGEVGCEALE